MGSALCFPILALTVWSLLTAVAPDEDTRDGILVYGDDVIVPKAYALEAIERLESFGLKVNREKSCISGLFRESCGADAYKGECVTPVRLRTVWSSSSSPDVYSSWISYANSFYDKQFFTTYDAIVGMLHAVYGELPDESLDINWPHGQPYPYPCLREVPRDWLPKRHRTNHNLQKKEWLVRVIKVPKIKHVSDGWEMLLRFFAESANSSNRIGLVLPALVDNTRAVNHWESLCQYGEEVPFRVGTYTQRRTSMLVRRWR